MEFWKKCAIILKKGWRVQEMYKFDEEKMLNHLNEKWINQECPYCHHSEWNLDGGVYTPLEVQNVNGVIRKTEMLPLAAVTCVHCGNTVFVNVIAAGCMETEEK